MNILILSWRGLKHPQAGGAEISTHEHAKRWVRTGHSVTLFTSAFVNCKAYEVIDGVRIKRCGRQIFGVQWEALRWYLFGEHPKFDLVIDQFHGIPFFAPLYVGVKKLAFIHEVTKEVWSLNPWPWPINRIAAFLGLIFEPLFFKLVYKKTPFMTVSESTKDDLMKWGIPESCITVIYNGTTVPKSLKLPFKEKKKTGIYLGAISKDKGIEDAIIIFSKILEKENDWQFWIVGKSDSGYLKKLKMKSKNSGINKKVKFWGYVSEEKKFELLSRAHVAINPSVREGWGLVVIEAASMGTPTIAFNVPGLRDSIINNKSGIICSGNSLESFAKKTLDMVNNTERYNQMRKNAILWSRKFSWEKSAKDSLKLINKIYEI